MTMVNSGLNIVRDFKGRSEKKTIVLDFKESQRKKQTLSLISKGRSEKKPIVLDFKGSILAPLKLKGTGPG